MHLSPFANTIIVNDCLDVIAANEPMYTLIKIIAKIVIVFIVVLFGENRSFKIDALSEINVIDNDIQHHGTI
jgi:hypothetical protein